MVAGVCAWLQGVSMVAREGHAWLPGGVSGCRGCMHRIRRDTVNERAARILPECILVINANKSRFSTTTLCTVSSILIVFLGRQNGIISVF